MSTSNVIGRGDDGYAPLRQAAIWNAVVPERFPDAIVRPRSRGELVAAVREAAADGRRIAIKSGGHNWLGACIRDGGLLIDLGLLDAVEVDAERGMALVEPGGTHKVLADAIVPHGYAFPIGHCPTVGLGGYLLAGGFGWNPRAWGPACWSVEALDVVGLDGSELFVSESEHADLYWAARGGGGGFPGIVARSHVRLQPLPTIVSRRSAYPLGCMPELLAWSAGVQDQPANVEISLIARRPLLEGGRRDEPRVTVVATGFADTTEAAEALVVTATADAPAADSLLEPPVAAQVALNDLEGEGGWTRGLRYAVDMLWVEEEGLEDIGAICARALRYAPSELSRIVFAWGFFPENGPDVALSANGKLTVNLYSTWEEPGDDRPNVAWLRALVAELEPWTTGFYVGESDLAAGPDRPRRGYTEANWRRLQEIRARHNPDRRKFGYLSEP